MTKPNDEAMTPEQIENWRKMLSKTIGPYAFLMPDVQIEIMRDKFQKQLDAMSEAKP